MASNNYYLVILIGGQKDKKTRHVSTDSLLRTKAVSHPLPQSSRSKLGLHCPFKWLPTWYGMPMVMGNTIRPFWGTADLVVLRKSKCAGRARRRLFASKS